MIAVTTLPGGMTLSEWFRALWPILDPTLALEALGILTEDAHRHRLPPAVENEAEAVRLVWEEGPALAITRLPPVIAQEMPLPRSLAEVKRRSRPGVLEFEGRQIQAFLRQARGTASPVPRDRLMLEERVRKILVAIVDMARRGAIRITAIHPASQRRVEIEPELLEGLGGADRTRDQVTTPIGVFRSVKVHTLPEHEHDPAQLALGEAPGQPKKSTNEEYLRTLQANGWSPQSSGQTWKEIAREAKANTDGKGCSARQLQDIWTSRAAADHAVLTATARGAPR
jgi:hypothetical protein